MEVAVQLFGIFCGVLCRTLFPFLRKLAQGKIKKFGVKYFYQALGAFIISVIFSLVILSSYKIHNIDGSVNFLSLLKLFSVAFSFGFTFNSLVNEAGNWGNK